MTHYDLAFGVRAMKPIPVDHGYALYGAISRLVPEAHRENGIAVHPIPGQPVGDRLLSLMPWSSLTIRVPDGEVAPLLNLAGKTLRLGEATLQVGVPQLRGLVPAPALRSRLVVIKVANTTAGQLTPDLFTSAARKQLTELGISEQAILTLPTRPDGHPRRRTLRVKHSEIVGYEVVVEGLTAEESLTLQTHGLGGKHHMGCGVFVPWERPPGRRP
jgi:CRISPR-associated protein Cas6